ncbi:MAG: cysteine--tRNA ligase, partial [Mesotoga sp.]|nr:cysteine--tRNA ligase [Mesotoga sp.]
IDKGYHPAEYRYYILGAHYKKQLAFTLEALDGAKSAMKKLVTRIGELKESEAPFSEPNSVLLNEFHEAINDDLNTPRALAVLWKVVDSDDLRPGEKLSLIGEFDRVLALGLSEIETEVIPEEVEELANQRDQARRNKDWKKADELRGMISEKGYEVLDERDGYKIRKK